MDNNAQNPSDGKYVVIENGQRVTTPQNQQEAQQEADRRNKLAEAQGHKGGGNAQVKQNILGAVAAILVPVVSTCATMCTNW